MTKISGTAEWAASNENISKGCSHGCLYCYAHAMAARFGRVHADGWTAMVDKPGAVKGYRKRKGRIMFPTTHDITPENVNLCSGALQRMLRVGNKLLVVSKPHTEVARQLVANLAPWREQVMFRFTIGSASDNSLSFWEPGAPVFAERRESLSMAHLAGYATSVSMEPILDIEEDTICELVEGLAPLVTDSIWLGKANRLMVRLSQNGHLPMAKRRATELLASQCDERIRSLYRRLKDNSVVKWKESIKEVVGLDLATKAGLDI